MLESTYQGRLIKKINRLLIGCFVQKNSTDFIQGFPDLTIYYLDMWAMLEVKASANSPEQPNQRYYIEMFDRMSFAAFIYPEIEEEVLRDLQIAFEPRRNSRFLKR